MTRIDGSHRMSEGLDGGAGAGVNLTNAVMKPILLLIFMGLQILDVLSTNLVLANGAWEANPLGSVGDSEHGSVVVASQAGSHARSARS